MKKSSFAGRLVIHELDKAWLDIGQPSPSYPEIYRANTANSQYLLVVMYSPFGSVASNWFRIYRKLNDSKQFILIVDFLGVGNVGEFSAEKSAVGTSVYRLQILDTSGTPWFIFTDAMRKDP